MQALNWLQLQTPKKIREFLRIKPSFTLGTPRSRKNESFDSFLSAIGKQPLTTYEASHHVISAIQQRDKPVNITDMFALESSVVDWGNFQIFENFSASSFSPLLVAEMSLYSGFSGNSKAIAEFDSPRDQSSKKNQLEFLKTYDTSTSLVTYSLRRQLFPDQCQL